MILVTRFYCYKAGEFLLVDAPVAEAPQRRRALLAEGYVITHTEVV